MTSGNPNAGQGSPPSQHTVPNTPASPPNKRDLKSWWKGFKLPTKHQEASQQEHRGPGIFGVPLRQSITYANVAISLVDENGQSYIYGYVPIVVAKCGVFLKEKATSVEGIFRLSGSEKRIKELKTIFDSPDRYGKGLVWEGYTVHDAANVLRRYLNDLPEPVVPLDLYEKFRNPLRGATKQAVGDVEGPQFVEHFNEKAAIAKYQRLITELPPLNKQLLLYILDLLAVFAAKSDENRMNSQNLAAIFQPGMLSHPAHAMAPEEYRLNQCVIIFLIENQDHFLIGMQGTAADETTMAEVASGNPNGPYTPNPNRNSGGLGRTASNASAGAESVRRDGKVRRNRSASSRHSRGDGSVTPNSPAVATTPTGGLGRSNTVPSKKSPALVGGKFKKHESPGRTPHSPALEALTQAHPYDETTRTGAISSPGHPPYDTTYLSPEPGTSSGRSQERLLEVPGESSTPSKDRSLQNNLQNLFQRSPNNDSRQPNKLKKKRIPGSLNISAQSSVTSLPQTASNAASPGVEAANPMETSAHSSLQPVAQPIFQPNPVSQPPMQQPTHQVSSHSLDPQGQQEQHSQHHPLATHQTPDVFNDGTLRYTEIHSNSSLRPEDFTRGKKSPPASLHSSFNEGSDIDQVAHEVPTSHLAEGADKEKKSRWRMSRRKDDAVGYSGSPVASPPRVNIGSNHNADVSTTSIGSSVAKPRHSFTGDSTEQFGGNGERIYTHDSGKDSYKEEGKGPIGWIRNKYREAKETAEQRRNKSPPPTEHHTLSATFLAPRGKSLDIARENPRENERAETRHAHHEAPREARVAAPGPPQPAHDVPSYSHQTDAQKDLPQGMTIQRVISQTEEASSARPQAKEPAVVETTLQGSVSGTSAPDTSIPGPPQTHGPAHPEPQLSLSPVAENRQQEQEQEQQEQKQVQQQHPQEQQTDIPK